MRSHLRRKALSTFAKLMELNFAEHATLSLTKVITLMWLGAMTVLDLELRKMVAFLAAKDDPKHLEQRMCKALALKHLYPTEWPDIY